MNRAKIRAIPFRHFIVVAASGMVAFVAFFQGLFSLGNYHPCSLLNSSYVIPANPQAAGIQFSLSLLALFVLFSGAKRLRKGFESGATAYAIAVTSLLIGEGLLSFLFIRMSAVCAG